MVYKKNYKYKKPYGRYAGKGVKRGMVYGAAAGQLWKDVKNLKNLINVEFKTKDMVASTNISTTSTGVLLNGLAKGDDYNNREGRQVRMKSSQLQLRLNMNASATTATTVRWFLLLDKQPNAAGFSMSDVLDTSTAGGVDAFRELSTRRRFVILNEGRVNLNSNYPEKLVVKYKKLDIKTVYDASDAGDITDITSNALWLFMVSDDGTNSPSVTYNHRLRFIDN